MLPPLDRHLGFSGEQWKVRRKTAGWLTRRKLRPWPEGLEGRTLLSSITEYPIAGDNAGGSSVALNQITAGSDGNVWFTDDVN